MLSTEVSKEKQKNRKGDLRGMDTQVQLAPYQFKKGVSGNPAGRPKGSLSLKEFARDYLLSLDEAGKVEFMNHLPHDLIWRMAEGNPHSTEDVRHTVAPTPIMDIVKIDSKVIDGAPVIDDGARGAGALPMSDASPAVDSGQMHGVILDSGTGSVEKGQ